MNKTKFLKNVVISFGGELFTLILGIVVPHFMIKGYGSDVNGLLGTITQVFTYLALLEAGIGQAARNALYKPIAEKNQKEISVIASSARNYYRRVAGYYAVCVLLLAALLPFLLKTNVDKITVFLVVLFEGAASVLSFYYVQAITTVLAADGRSYINNSINYLNRAVSYAAKIILACNGISIILLQIIHCVITLLKVIFYQTYFKRNYSWVSFSEDTGKGKLENRGAYIITEIAWTVFSSTDMVVLSIFVSTKMASIYSIYNMVFSSLNILLNSIYHSVTYLLGRTYHENLEKYTRLHDLYNTVFVSLMTILMSVAYLLIIPFVKLYTGNIADVEYVYHELPLMFCLVQLLSWSRYVPGNLIAVAGYVKRASKISVIEAVINVVLSVVLVKKYGIVGVLGATVAALPVKVIYCNYLADKVILKRAGRKTLTVLGTNCIVFGTAVFLNSRLSLEIHNYLQFLGFGLLLTASFTLYAFILNVILNRDSIIMLKTMYLTSEARR